MQEQIKGIIIISWPTPHTTPFFLPPEDPFPVLLRHNSTPLWEPDPAPARRPRQQQAGTGHGRLERAPGRRRHAIQDHFLLTKRTQFIVGGCRAVDGAGQAASRGRVEFGLGDPYTRSQQGNCINTRNGGIVKQCKRTLGILLYWGGKA